MLVFSFYACVVAFLELTVTHTISLHELLFKISFQDTHTNLFNFLSFHLISHQHLLLNVVFDANTLFRLYLPISSSDYWQCTKSAAFHIKLAEAPTFPHVTFYDKNKVQIGNLQSGNKTAAIKLTVVFTNKKSKIELEWMKKKYCIYTEILCEYYSQQINERSVKYWMVR